MKRRHEKPLKRKNPGGAIVWVARWTGKDGKRRSAGTFELKRDAQTAIDAAYDRQDIGNRRDTVGAYAEKWLERHPRSERTNRSYRQRVGYVLDVRLEGAALRDWPMIDLRRRHAADLLAVLLVDQGRSANGAQGVLRVLSAMFSDAIEDDLATMNPFFRVKVRATDARVAKAPRAVQVLSLEQMHYFAQKAARQDRDSPEMQPWRHVYAESMVRVLSDCGLRLGELLALRRTDVKLGKCDEGGCSAPGPHLHVRWTAHEGKVQAGTKTDHGKAEAGRVVPVPPSLAGMLRVLPLRIDTILLFPTPRGKVWRERNFYRQVWDPPRRFLNVTPHDFRHSWVTHMRAAGVDPADLAAAAGHTVQTATAHYTHALHRSYESMRSAVG